MGSSMAAAADTHTANALILFGSRPAARGCGTVAAVGLFRLHAAAATAPHRCLPPLRTAATAHWTLSAPPSSLPRAAVRALAVDYAE
ncbi:hypothetical protein Stsp01_08370 [Streptomyces sp. NBRC 13847]|nr:hypothetical protein Stsp01_08370 [Streptomyces sp. NBRC 13847]